MGPPPLCTHVVPLAERVALRVHGTPLLFLPVFMPTAQKMSLVASGKGKLRPRELAACLIQTGREQPSSRFKSRSVSCLKP